MFGVNKTQWNIPLFKVQNDQNKFPNGKYDL